MTDSNKNQKFLKGGLGGDAGTPLIPQAVQPPSIVDPRTPGRDLKLISQAVRKKWIVREEAFAALPNSMLALALDRETDARARVAAARVLMEMNAEADGQNNSKGTTVNVGVVVNNDEDFYR